jgi:hypothetical protein
MFITGSTYLFFQLLLVSGNNTTVQAVSPLGDLVLPELCYKLIAAFFLIAKKKNGLRNCLELLSSVL